MINKMIFDTTADAKSFISDYNIKDYKLYSSYPVEIPGLKSKRQRKISIISLVGSIFGLIMFVLLYFKPFFWDYPVNAGSKPLNSIWPAIPLMFSLAVLFAVVFIFIRFIFQKRKTITELPLTNPHSTILIYEEK